MTNIICTHRQGRKSMFKHGGGDNIREKYTSRLRIKRRALLGGFEGMPPPRENF